MKYIVKARNTEYTPVYAPMYKIVPKDFDSFKTMNPINVNKEKTNENSIVSLIELYKPEFFDISGSSCKMVTKVYDVVRIDDVTIIGENSQAYTVQIDDEIYNVHKSIARFVKEV